METPENWLVTVSNVLTKPENRVIVVIGLVVITLSLAANLGESVGRFIYHLTH